MEKLVEKIWYHVITVLLCLCLVLFTAYTNGRLIENGCRDEGEYQLFNKAVIVCSVRVPSVQQ